MKFKDSLLSELLILIFLLLICYVGYLLGNSLVLSYFSTKTQNFNIVIDYTNPMSDLYVLLLLVGLGIMSGFYNFWLNKGQQVYHKKSHSERVFIIDMLEKIKDKLDEKL